MIIWYCHKDTGVLTSEITGGVVSRLNGKYGTTVEREIKFHDGAQVVTLDVAAQGLFIARVKNSETGLPTGEARLWDAQWDVPTVAGKGYILSISFYGSALDGLDRDSLGNILLAGEIHFVNPTKAKKSQTLDVVVEPAIYSDEELPDDLEPLLPMPASIITLGVEYGNFRISSFGMEIKEPATGIWRRVSFVDGQLTYEQLS